MIFLDLCDLEDRVCGGNVLAGKFMQGDFWRESCGEIFRYLYRAAARPPGRLGC